MEDLTPIIRPSVSLILSDINRFFTAEGVQSYLVGGFVRDILLGRDTADIDIAVAGDALKIAPGLSAALSGRYVQLDGENGIGRIVLSDNKVEIDVATLKGDIEYDLAQRDFTIDAIAIELENVIGPDINIDMLIDPFQGRDDLSRGVVRAVSETSFTSDAARLIRAVRLAAELGFSIDCGTEALLGQQSHLIANVAGERVREELLRILALPGAGQRMSYLGELGILTTLIPELAPARGVSQPKIHIWDVFEHSIETVSAAEFLLREGTWEHASEEILKPVPWSAKLSKHFSRDVSHGSTRRSLLKLAALLHDIAKPQTKTIDEDGRARFLGHPQEGAATAARILERLRFSAREIKLVELMVRYHLRPTQMSQEGLPSRRAIYRYFRDTADDGIDILFLSLADHLATRGKFLDVLQWREHARVVEYVITEYFEAKSTPVPVKLIDGHDLMEIFGLSPGPRVGELLEELREAQAAGEVTTRSQGLEYIRRLLAAPARTHLNEHSQGDT